jgi:dipeptidyl aminopeptidase/acylaminoacyl peptidase
MSAKIAQRLSAIIWLFALCFAPKTVHAADSPPPLEEYGALPRTETVELSPDGTMIAMVETQNDARLLSIKRTDETVLARAALGDLKLAGLEWVGNEYVIVYLHQTSRLSVGGSDQEFTQGVVLDVKDGKSHALMRSSPEYLPAVFGHYGVAQQDGRWVGYFGLVPLEPSHNSTDRGGFFKQRYPDLYQVDLENGAAHRVTPGNAKRRSWAMDSTGQIIAESEYDTNSGNWRVFRRNEPDKPLVSGNSPFGFSLVGLGRTAGTILVHQEGPNADTFELNLDTGKTDNFLPPGKAAGLIHARDTRLLLGAVLIDENQMLMFDPVLDRHLRAIGKAFSGDAMSLSSASSDLSRVIVHVAGKGTAGTWQLVDFKTGKAVPMADDYPGIPDDMIGHTEMIDYRAGDGLAMQGVLTLPPGRDPHNLPVVMLPHGGPEARDRVHFDWWAQAFAARGYAVFQPNFRGSSGYGIAFRNAGFGQWGRKMQTDISDGLAALTAKGIVDPHRACIVGASYGGYAALAGVTLQHGLYRCAASYGGVSDMRDMIYAAKAKDRGDTQHYADPAMRFWLSYLGADSPDDRALNAISPQAQAKNADAPVLIVYGQNDTVVPPDQSRDMASALKSAGKPVELVALHGEDHWLSRSDTRLQMLKAMVAFVEKYNPPDTPH